MGQLDYELVDDDFVALNLRLAVTHPGVRQMNGRTRVVFTVLLSFLVGVGWCWSDVEVDQSINLWVCLGLVVAAALVAWFGWAALVRWDTKLRLRAVIRQSSVGGYSGLYHLEWTQAGVREDAPHRTLIATWAQLSRVEETPEYLFLYLNELEALVVPTRVGRGVEELALEARARIGS